MRIMKYVLALVFALGLAIPSFAVELSLGGFPSFMRFRWRSLHNATYHNILTPGELAGITGLDGDATGEHIHFADMTLRLTPQLVLSDAVTVRASKKADKNAETKQNIKDRVTFDSIVRSNFVKMVSIKFFMK